MGVVPYCLFAQPKTAMVQCVLHMLRSSAVRMIRMGLLSALVMLVVRLMQALSRRRSLKNSISPLRVQNGTCLQTLHEPLVLRVPVGTCVESWTDDYLQERLKSTKISVHVSDTPFLNFEKKNFSYQVLQFNEFLDRVQQGTGPRFLYYRSQNSDRKKPSNLEAINQDGSTAILGKDFKLPSDLLAPYQVHSTVLRIASTGLCMWLHYDVCDNFLCCIRGRKRVLLFHPDDIGLLYISGSSSALGSRLLKADLSELWEKFPLAKVAWSRRREVELSAGDVLFLPAFWPHCTEALPHVDRASISVNTFVLQRETMSLHDPKDVWANRELLSAQDAIKAFEEKVLPSLAKLPQVPRSFYCRKLASQLEAMSQPSDSGQVTEAKI